MWIKTTLFYMRRITNVCVHCQFMLLENYLPVAGGSLSQIAQIQKKQIWESFEQPEFIRWMIDVLLLNFCSMMMNPTLCNLDSTKKNCRHISIWIRENHLKKGSLKRYLYLSFNASRILEVPLSGNITPSKWMNIYLLDKGHWLMQNI